MSTQFSNKNPNALESMPEGVTWLQKGLEMPNNRTKWLLDQLKVEFERDAYRKNIKIETLIRKFKKEGLSERAACYLLGRGVDITTISVLLGHSSIKVTMEFYARVKPEALKKAVGMFDV